jgi:hypothetical protein
MTTRTPPETISTICRRTGRECSAALRAADHLADAARSACRARPGFAMTGQIQLRGCAQGCMAHFTLSAARIEMFCDAGVNPDVAALGAFADSFFGSGNRVGGLRGLKAAPRAMVRKTVGPALAHGSAAAVSG